MFVVLRQNMSIDYPEQFKSMLSRYEKGRSRIDLLDMFEIGYMCGAKQQTDFLSASNKVGIISDYFNHHIITLKERSILFLALINDPTLNIEKTIESKLESNHQELEYFITEADFYDDPVTKALIEEQKFAEIVQKKPKNGYPIISLEEEKMNQSYIDSLIAEELQSEINSLTLARAKEPETNCEICLELLSSKEFIAFDHCPHVYHRECIHTFVKEAVKARKLEIKCPSGNCKESLTSNDIQEIIDGELLDQYLQNKLELYISANEKDISYCPTPGCNYAFIHGGQPEFFCPKCHSHYCLDCRVQYHVGKSCLEYKRDKINNTHGVADDQFLNFVRGSNFKQCATCKFWVEKSQGCNHMTCRCSYQFCYVCGLKWKTCGCK